VDQYKEAVIGTKLPKKDIEKFPLLIKLIDANNDLSIQVHPDDRYANEFENGEYGKNEMWYVVDCKEGAKLVYDVKKDIDKEAFIKAVENNTVEDTLNFVSVSPGDCFNIPAGLVHAIGTGLLICEVQQNSNTTYRVFDYNRVDDNGNKRQLHIGKALDVIDFSHNYQHEKCPGLIIDKENISVKFIVANQYFAVEHISVSGKVTEDTKEERFYTYTVLKGEGKINDTLISKGESVLIPAKLGVYTITGDFEAIRSYIPDLKENIINPLLEAGYSLNEIKEKITG
ncbi:MAG: class I mannose-6-phosphate isomerase, partial [Clostridia bacterium]|nr:class I mannose-6-phosphate isomerase [Clostridia bacterium]